MGISVSLHGSGNIDAFFAVGLLIKIRVSGYMGSDKWETHNKGNFCECSLSMYFDNNTLCYLLKLLSAHKIWHNLRLLGFIMC